MKRTAKIGRGPNGCYMYYHTAVNKDIFVGSDNSIPEIKDDLYFI